MFVLCIYECTLFFMAEKRRNYIEKIKTSNEKEKLRLYKIVIFGPSRVGKSSLFQVLLGNLPKMIQKAQGFTNIKCSKLL